MKRIKEKQTGLKISYHSSGDLEYITKFERYTNYENESADGKIVTLPVGAFVSFYADGGVKKIAQYGSPICLEGTCSNPGRFLWQQNLLWSKEFDENGKLLTAVGKQGSFEPDSEISEILDRKKLMYAVYVALQPKAEPIVKTTLTHKIKTSAKMRECLKKEKE